MLLRCGTVGLRQAVKQVFQKSVFETDLLSLDSAHYSIATGHS